MMSTVSAERLGKTNLGCYNCRSAATVVEKTVCYFSRAGTSPLYVENMPVEICRVCGIAVFPNPSRITLKQARAGELIPVAHRRVLVFDLKTPDAKPEKVSAAGRWSNIRTICYNCRSRNTVEKGTILYFQKSGADPLFVENLPAEVCRLCGPRYYPGKVLTTLDNQIRGGRGTPVAHRSVPVFDLKNPDAKLGKAKAAATVPALAEIPGD